MHAKTRQRRCLPPLLRVFTPTRLTEELLAGVYERLLDAGHHSSPVPAEAPAIDPQANCLDNKQTVTTGGQS